MSLEDLPVGSNVISFSRVKAERGVEYRFESREDGWHFVFKGKARPGSTYYLNGKPVTLPSSGIEMTGKQNRILMVH